MAKNKVNPETEVPKEVATDEEEVKINADDIPEPVVFKEPEPVAEMAAKGKYYQELFSGGK